MHSQLHGLRVVLWGAKKITEQLFPATANVICAFFLYIECVFNILIYLFIFFPYSFY